MRFEDLDFRHVDRMSLFGEDFVQARVDFPNGYGASVVRGRGTYGYEDGLYELAVMKHGHLCYDSGICEDVAGHLTPEDVTEWLGKIEALPRAGMKPEKKTEGRRKRNG